MNDTVSFHLFGNCDIINYFLERNGNILKLKLGINMYIDVLDYQEKPNDGEIYLCVHNDNFIDFHKFLKRRGIHKYNFGLTYDGEWIEFVYGVIEQNRMDLLDYLIENNFLCPMTDGDLLEMYSYCLLHQACRYATVEMFVYLFNRIGVLQENTKIFASLLNSACEFGNFGIAEAILRKLKFSELELDCALIYAADGGDINIIELLVEFGADIKLLCNKLLRRAFIKNHCELFLYLMSKDANVDMITDDDIWCCIWSNNVDVVELLFKQREFKQHDIDDMLINSKNCTIEMVELLISNGANIDNCCEKLREDAKKCNNLKLVKYLKKIK